MYRDLEIDLEHGTARQTSVDPHQMAFAVDRLVCPRTCSRVTPQENMDEVDQWRRSMESVRCDRWTDNTES